MYQLRIYTLRDGTERKVKIKEVNVSDIKQK